MKALVVSDLHLEFSVIDLSEAAAQAEIVILAGDIHLGSKAIPWIAEQFAGLPVLYVPGNHEFYRGTHADVLQALRAAAAQHADIHILDRDSLVLGDIEFLGATLWTDFALYGDVQAGMQAASARMPDFTGVIKMKDGVIERPLSAPDTCAIHAESRAWLAHMLARPTARRRVVITHHLPADESVSLRYRGDPLSPAFASHLEDLVRQADVWIHGHTHDCLDYRLGECRVICNPRGYVVPGRAPENPAFAPRIIEL